MEVSQKEVKERIDNEVIYTSVIVVKMGVPSEAEELGRAMDEMMLEILGV